MSECAPVPALVDESGGERRCHRDRPEKVEESREGPEIGEDHIILGYD
ncbi:hypothetical protein SAMN04487904_101451 [Actinopolyspora lacussalsi subsp. righensis]|uniref:Uncharacterized protein n=1 Tax=Actinopolyspora righensis TaxID=995060 RepID=A0A1I6XBY7_9ACTN|nr:hypothetical protein SAMN04487904_101451 [Actinopolyspora righensis]